jgi:hypothetical protein
MQCKFLTGPLKDMVFMVQLYTKNNLGMEYIAILLTKEQTKALDLTPFDGDVGHYGMLGIDEEILYERISHESRYIARDYDSPGRWFTWDMQCFEIMAETNKEAIAFLKK